MYLKRQKYSDNILQPSISSLVIDMFGGVLLFENSYIFRYLYKFTHSLATYIMLFSQKLFSLSSHLMFLSNYSFCRVKKVRYSDINIDYHFQNDFMSYQKTLLSYQETLLSYQETLLSYRKTLLSYRETLLSYRESLLEVQKTFISILKIIYMI
jgi:hypothetical protein